LIGVLVAIAFQINNMQSAISPLALCVAFGFIVANFAQWPAFAAPATKVSSKTIMRIGVALLGAQVSVKMSGELGLLIGVGFGVCGATAVAAIRPQTRATEEETSYAIGLIALCGTLSIFMLPLIGHAIGLDTREFGAWAGAAVHDVGQVVATASVWGDDADKYAIVIKLSRVCLLAPIVLILSIRHRRWLTSQGKQEVESAKVPLIPFFVLGFIAVAVLNNLVDINDGLHDNIVLLSKLMLGAGLVALGSGVRWKSIRAIGPRPMAMGMVAWVLVAGVALAAVKITGL
jgi:uncharacterized integral membrane protein (TIGR00698 family)